MRDFFIRGFEMIVNVLVVSMLAGVVGLAGYAAFSGQTVINGMEGWLAALIILAGGGVYVVIVAGLLYLGLGIYQNTKRTADLLERG